MKVLIIGGTHFIGPELVSYLCDRGHAVTLFNRGRSLINLKKSVPCIVGDRNQLHQHAQELSRLAPDVVVDMMQLTEQHARDLIQVMQHSAKRFIVISSMDVYRAWGIFLGKELAPLEPLPLTEQSPVRMHRYIYRGEQMSLEEYEKIAVEEVIMQNQEVPGTILRLPMVYGPRDYLHRFFEFLNPMIAGRPAIILPDPYAQWTTTRAYVENVAVAIGMAVENANSAGQIFNVGEPSPLSTIELLKMIAQSVEWHGDVITYAEDSTTQQIQAVNYEQNIIADTTKIRNTLGYTEQISFEAGLEKTIAWQRMNPPKNRAHESFEEEDKFLEALAMGALPQEIVHRFTI